MLAVHDGTHSGSLTCASEVSLEGWSACVQTRKNISVVRPCIPEILLQRLVSEFFEGRACWLPCQPHLRHLNVSNLPREDSLNDIGAIEAIHTISSHHTYLPAFNTARLSIDEFSLPKANFHLSDEMPIA